MRFLILSSLVVCVAGCGGNVDSNDFSQVKGRVGKLEVRVGKNEKVDETQTGFLLKQDAQIKALQNASAQNQMGGTAQQYLPSHIGGVPVVPTWMAYDPNRARPALIPGTYQGMPTYEAIPYREYGPYGQPQGPSAPPAPGFQQPGMPGQGNQQPAAPQPAPNSVAGGGFGGVRSQIQDATNLLRDVKDLRQIADELFGGGGQQQQIAALNQRVDLLSAEQERLRQQLSAEYERLKREQMAARGDIDQLKKVVDDYIARLKALGYEVERCSKKPTTVTKEYIYVWQTYSYWGRRSCEYHFGCTPTGVIHYYPCY